VFDTTDLSSTNRETDSGGICSLPAKTFELVRESFVQQRKNDEEETEKAPFLVVKKIRDAILDETFKPGDRLPEAELGEMFEVSRSPVREALLALEKRRGRQKFVASYCDCSTSTVSNWLHYRKLPTGE
jgi:Bacterial regulatory proteins, gntR family